MHHPNMSRILGLLRTGVRAGRLARSVSWLLLAGWLAPAQTPVHPGNLHHRVFAVVPMIGTGTSEDPRRPAYTPVLRNQGDPAARPEIGFTAVVSDDGRFALVEFVARDRSALKDLLDDKRPDVKIFEKGKTRRPDIEREFRLRKSTIDLSRMEVARP